MRYDNILLPRTFCSDSPQSPFQRAHSTRSVSCTRLQLVLLLLTSMAAGQTMAMPPPKTAPTTLPRPQNPVPSQLNPLAAPYTPIAAPTAQPAQAVPVKQGFWLWTAPHWHYPK